MMQEGVQKVSWDEVSDAAEGMFSVWHMGEELPWAEEAWGHLEKDGLTRANTILERTESQLRLLVLAVAYRELCRLAWEENADLSLGQLSEELELDPLSLGILAARAKADVGQCDREDWEIRDSALAVMTNHLRLQVFDSLCAAYGSSHVLYSRLWHTRNAEANQPDSEFELSAENRIAYLFVTNGFCM